MKTATDIVSQMLLASKTADFLSVSQRLSLSPIVFRNLLFKWLGLKQHGGSIYNLHAVTTLRDLEQLRM